MVKTQRKIVSAQQVLAETSAPAADGYRSSFAYYLYIFNRTCSDACTIQDFICAVLVMC